MYELHNMVNYCMFSTWNKYWCGSQIAIIVDDVLVSSHFSLGSVLQVLVVAMNCRCQRLWLIEFLVISQIMIFEGDPTSWVFNSYVDCAKNFLSFTFFVFVYLQHFHLDNFMKACSSRSIVCNMRHMSMLDFFKFCCGNISQWQLFP